MPGWRATSSRQYLRADEARVNLPSGLSPSVVELHHINPLLEAEGSRTLPPVRTCTDPGTRASSQLVAHTLLRFVRVSSRTGHPRRGPLGGGALKGTTR